MEEVAAMAVVGVAVTMTVMVFTALAQAPEEPLTEYTVVEEGLTTMLAPEPEGSQV